MRTVDTTIREPATAASSPSGNVRSTANMADRLRDLAERIDSAPNIEAIKDRMEVGMALYHASLAVMQEHHPLDDLRSELLQRITVMDNEDELHDAIESGSRDETFACQSRMRGTQLQCGGETMCVVDWAKKIGLTRHDICARIRAGWTIAQAVGKEPPPERAEALDYVHRPAVSHGEPR